MYCLSTSLSQPGEQVHGTHILQVDLMVSINLYLLKFEKGPTAVGFHTSVYQSLRMLTSGDYGTFKESLNFARLETIRTLSTESMNISPVLSR